MSSAAPSNELHRAAQRVRLAVFDVDGVLTNGSLLYSSDGETLKNFDVRDGLGIKLLAAAGITVAVITARDSGPLRRRLQDLGVEHFYANCPAKLDALRELATQLGVELTEVAYTGDDLIDLPPLRAVGMPIAVHNSHALVKKVARWTTPTSGGCGAVRQIAEFIIGCQQDFPAFVEAYLTQRTQTKPLSHQRHNLLPYYVVIPARYGSSRLPGKPLLPIAGRPMIQHVYENASAAQAAQVLVATDDQRIFDEVEKFGGHSVLTSTDHVSGTDRIAEVATQLHWSKDSIVVNVQGDEPLLDVDLIELVANTLIEQPQAGISTIATPIYNSEDLFDPNLVKVVLNSEGLAQYFSRAPIPWVRDLFARNVGREKLELPSGVPFLRHLGVYAYRVGTLKKLSQSAHTALEGAESLEQLRALSLGIQIAVATVEKAPGHGVDTPADLERVSREVEARTSGSRTGVQNQVTC